MKAKNENKGLANLPEIEREFFEFDEENKLVLLHLVFDSPSAIFDSNAITKIPVLSDGFMDWPKTANNVPITVIS